MINKLHLAMIELYNGDAKRIQHFCKVYSYARLIAEAENVDDETLYYAATLAKEHSNGKNSSKVEVDYTLVKYVHKEIGAKPGMVLVCNQV